MQSKIAICLCSSKRASFFVRFDGRFFAPACAQKGAARRGCQDGPSQAPAKRLGLDGPEHGAMLTANRAFTTQAPVSCHGKSTGEAPEPNFALANGHGIYRDLGLNFGAQPLNLRSQHYCVDLQNEHRAGLWSRALVTAVQNRGSLRGVYLAHSLPEPSSTRKPGARGQWPTGRRFLFFLRRIAELHDIVSACSFSRQGAVR